MYKIYNKKGPVYIPSFDSNTGKQQHRHKIKTYFFPQFFRMYQ